MSKKKQKQKTQNRRITFKLEASEAKHAQTEKALQQRNRELALIHRASQAVNSALTLDRVLTTLLEEVRHLIDVIACSAWLIDPETNELVCQQATGPQNETVRGWRLPPGEGIGGQTVLVGVCVRHNQALAVVHRPTGDALARR